MMSYFILMMSYLYLWCLMSSFFILDDRRQTVPATKRMATKWPRDEMAGDEVSPRRNARRRNGGNETAATKTRRRKGMYPISNSSSTTNVIVQTSQLERPEISALLLNVMTRRYTCMLLHRSTKLCLQRFWSTWLTSGVTIIVSLPLLQNNQLYLFPKLGVVMYLTKKYHKNDDFLTDLSMEIASSLTGALTWLHAWPGCSWN